MTSTKNRRFSWLALPILLAAPPAGAHDWYIGEHSPDGRLLCCDNFDCSPIPSRLDGATGELQVQLGGQWWPATDPRWYLGPSPDGAAAGCMLSTDSHPRCVWVGLGT